MERCQAEAAALYAKLQAVMMCGALHINSAQEVNSHLSWAGLEPAPLEAPKPSPFKLTDHWASVLLTDQCIFIIACDVIPV